MTQVILASTSAIRRELLIRAGIDIIVMPPETDEAALTRGLGRVGPGHTARTLARAKALSVSNRSGAVFVIGADQVLAIDGDIYEKPRTKDEARAQLKALKNRQHTLESAVSIAQNGVEIWHHLGNASLVMRDFSDDFLEAYLDRMGADALTSVGAYKIEGLGVQLFERIDGDHFTVLGLPLLAVLKFLRGNGVIPS